MLNNYLKLAWRNLIRDRRFALLNLIGLSTGLACTILIYLWVSDELSVRKFNGDKRESRLFQVLKNSPDPTGISTDEHTPGLLASTLAEQMPEVEAATSVIPVSWFDKRGTISGNDHAITANAQFAGRDYFSIFPYRLLEGDKDRVLTAKEAIVISSDLALRLFGTTANVTGKTIEWRLKDYNGSYVISGIFEKPAAAGGDQFDLVMNYDLFLEKNPKLLAWNNNDPSTYVLLKKGVNADHFNSEIANVLKAHNENSSSTLFIQRYADTYLYNHYDNGVPDGGRIQYVRLFSLIAIFILIMACINFMNLATARAAARSRETGIKKIMGARRATLIYQYLGEPILLSFLATGVALGLALLVLPYFSVITGKQLSMPLTTGFILAILGITLVTGILSGSYPALYLSGFRPAAVLRGGIVTSLPELLVRKGLVVFQFTLSAAFIVFVVLVYRQMQLIQTKDLGYDREHLLYFEKGGPVYGDKADYAPGGKYEADIDNFLQRVRDIPGVIDAANFRHNITNRNGGTYDLSWPGKAPDTRIDFTDLDVGFDFIETAGIHMKEGRPFSRSYGDERSKIIFNEAAIETMGLRDPIGKIVHLWGEDRVIIGVVHNFNFQSLHENLKPCFFDLSTNQWASKIMVRAQPGKESRTIRQLAVLYNGYNKGQPFEYRFLDDDYQALYSAEKRVAALSNYFAGIAIIISCLGLFGLAAFTAQKRQREIGIRKVVGATVTHIVFLLSGDFLKLTAISLAIALPFSWWAMNRWLSTFAFRIPIRPDVFLIAGISLFSITLLAVGIQAVKAAWINPVKSLRTE